jgi:RNA polymerase sigma-70 factor (ECF subfamily)
LKGVSVDTALRRSAGDPKAFAELYDAESEALVSFMARRTLDGQIALDLCAETFAQAFAGRRRFRGRSDEEARAFLYTIAQRQLIRFWRRGAVERRALHRLGMRVPHVDEDDHAAIEERAGLDHLRPAIHAQLDALSPEQREALRLRVIDELPYDEIAARLDVSEQTVRARVSRGLRTLGPRLQALAAHGANDE